MQIIEYFEDGQKEHWVKEIEASAGAPLSIWRNY